MKELMKTKIPVDLEEKIDIWEFGDQYREIDSSKWIKMITRSIHSLEFTKRVNYVGYYEEKRVKTDSFANIRDFEFLPEDLQEAYNDSFGLLKKVEHDLNGREAELYPYGPV